MSLAEYTTPSSDIYEDDVDVIITANGSKDLSKAGFRGGGLVGFKSCNERPPEEIPVEFVDWPFTEDNPSFEDHLEVVKREKPRYAVAPDIEDESNFHLRIDQADELSRYAEIVIVVPKDVEPSRVPNTFRVGIPSQNRFGGVPRPVWEYGECESIHLLGGSPARQQKLAGYITNIDSVDSASIAKGAMVGEVWMGDSWKEIDSNYYDRIEQSMENSVKMWNGRIDTERVKGIQEAISPDWATNELAVELPPGREELCLESDEVVPFPGRAYFHEENTLTHRGFIERYR